MSTATNSCSRTGRKESLAAHPTSALPRRAHQYHCAPAGPELLRHTWSAPDILPIPVYPNGTAWTSVSMMDDRLAGRLMSKPRGPSRSVMPPVTDTPVAAEWYQRALEAGPRALLTAFGTSGCSESTSTRVDNKYQCSGWTCRSQRAGRRPLAACGSARLDSVVKSWFSTLRKGRKHEQAYGNRSQSFGGDHPDRDDRNRDTVSPDTRRH